MGHNKYSFNRGVISDATVPAPCNIRLLDQQASESINGDEGGSWAPATPIVIGGSGVLVSTYGEFTGGVETGDSAVGLILGNSDYPTFSTTRSRTIMVPIRDLAFRTDFAVELDYDESVPGTTFCNQTASPQNLSGWIPSHRLFDGATITSVVLRYRVVTRPSSLPTHFPAFRIFSVPSTLAFTSTANDLYEYPAWQASHVYTEGDAVISAAHGHTGQIYRMVDTFGGLPTGATEPANFDGSQPVGTNITDGTPVWQAEFAVDDPRMFYVPRGNMVWAPSAPYGTSKDQFYAFGRVQTLTMTPNQNNVLDLLTKQYGFHIMNASGVSVNEIAYHSLQITMTGISNLKPVA